MFLFWQLTEYVPVWKMLQLDHRVAFSQFEVLSISDDFGLGQVVGKVSGTRMYQTCVYLLVFCLLRRSRIQKGGLHQPIVPSLLLEDFWGWFFTKDSYILMVSFYRQGQSALVESLRGGSRHTFI